MQYFVLSLFEQLAHINQTVLAFRNSNANLGPVPRQEIEAGRLPLLFHHCPVDFFNGLALSYIPMIACWSATVTIGCRQINSDLLGKSIHQHIARKVWQSAFRSGLADQLIRICDGLGSGRWRGGITLRTCMARRAVARRLV